MVAVKILDARGALVPLVAGPRRRDWRRAGPLGKGRNIAAMQEPWATELSVAKGWAGLYGACCGGAIAIELLIFHTAVQHGLFGLSIDATAGMIVLAASPLWWLTTPLFSGAARRKHAARLQAAYLKALRCPSCGASLGEDRHPSDDRRCPSCGATWRVNS